MTSYFITSVTVFIIVSYFFFKNIESRSSLFFFRNILFLMLFSSYLIIGDDYLETLTYNKSNAVIFYFLLFTLLLPWRNLEKKNKFYDIVVSNTKILGFIFTIVIVLAFIANGYLLPYSLKGISMGGGAVRDQLYETKMSMLPVSKFTTFAVATATASPIFLMFHFISLCDVKLKKYSVLLFLCSLSYINLSLSFMARDGFVITPILYFIFFRFFSRFYNFDLLSSKRNFRLLASLGLLMLLTISISRFYSEGDDSNEFVSGTFGYIGQEPYVFNAVIEETTDFYGFNLRFPVLAQIFYGEIIPIERDKPFQTMFGTQLADFYSVNGYLSLFLFTISFSIFFNTLFSFYLKKSGFHFNFLLIFSLYLLLIVQGLFYFRMGELSMNYFILTIIIFSFFRLPNFIKFQTHA